MVHYEASKVMINNRCSNYNQNHSVTEFKNQWKKTLQKRKENNLEEPEKALKNVLWFICAIQNCMLEFYHMLLINDLRLNYKNINYIATNFQNSGFKSNFLVNLTRKFSE